MNKPQPAVCFFGIYDPTYSRNRILADGFSQKGWLVYHCRIDPRRSGGIKKYLQLIWLTGRFRQKKPDLIIVAFPGQTVVWIARLFFGKRIIFDAFVSLYDSNVFDRRLYSSSSWWGRRDWFLDWYSCRLAWRVLLDTTEHINYFTKTFNLRRSKFLLVPVGADQRIFKPCPSPPTTGKITIHFHGSFIPLQGLRYIVEAADLLRDEGFIIQIIGAGQELEDIKKIIKSRELESCLKLIGRVPYEDLPIWINKADICLGIFGDTPKAARVVPNKVYECLAMGKAVVTADTPASREFFNNGKDILLCAPADSIALANLLRELKGDPARRQLLGEAGRRLFAQKFTAPQIVLGLLKQVDWPKGNC
jgi:glycosyltransferase involved in cell wall biosynthesis